MDQNEVHSEVCGPDFPPSGDSTWRAVARVLRSTVGYGVDSLSSILFPADCRVCGAQLAGFSRLPICSSCWNHLPAQSGLLCLRCGEALDAAAPETELLCRPCRAAAPPFEKAVAWGAYRDNLRMLLHLLKYEGMQPVAKRLGALLAQRVLEIPEVPGDLLVVPVPLFRGKRRQRGFNQSELLARSLTVVLRRRRPELKLKLKLAASALERQRSTESQAGLSPHQRRINVRGAFVAPRPEVVQNRHVLLIDDIYTTGATARACSLALRRAGAASIWVATVARAQKEFVVPSFLGDPAESSREEIPMEQDFAYWGEGRGAQTGGIER